MKTLDEIRSLLVEESATVEWKPGNVRHKEEIRGALRTLVAFANDLRGVGEAGAVVFGVDGARLKDEGLEAGTPGLSYEDSDSLEQRLRGWARTEVKGALPLTLERVALPRDPSRYLVVVFARPDDELRWYQDQLLVRDGSSTTVATASNGLLQVLQRRLVSRSPDLWDQPLPGVDLDVLDPELLSTELSRVAGARDPHELLRPEARLDAALGGRLCAPDPSHGGRLAPTRLAALLLTREPVLYLPGAWTELVVWSGPSRSSTARRRRLTGPLLRQFSEVEEALEALNVETVGSLDPESPGQQNQRLYSPRALREALANAYAHRDWISTEEVRVEVFPDRVEIASPGGLVDTTADLELWLEGHARPRWRNGWLAAALTQANITNRLGKGISIMVEETRRVAGRPPELRREADRFTVVIPAWRRPRPQVLPGQAGLVLVSIGGEPIEPWVRRDLEGLGLGGAPVVVAWHRRDYIGPAAEDWESVATDLKRELQPWIEDRELASLHLFIKGPVALAALVGALVPQVKPLIVYHFEDGRYHRAFTLDRRFLKS